MSAFNDIWISADQPRYIRLDNAAWVKAHTWNEQTWLSLPPSSNEFIVEASLGSYSMVLLGQLYESISKEELLDRSIRYIEDATKGFSDPAGHYILFITNSDTKYTYTITNRLGTYHAYHSTVAGVNMLSTYYIGLAKQASVKQLNWHAITGFMQMGYFPDADTWLQDISILEPASFYAFDERLNKVKQHRYWEWSYEPSTGTISTFHGELKDILDASLSISLKNKRVSLPLSGGLDSRTLAGVITDTDGYSSLWSYAYGFSEKSPETAIASKVAAAAHIPFNAYTVPNYLFAKAGIITDAVELFQYINGTRQASMIGKLSEDADAVVGGHWGDVWMDTMKVNDEDAATWFRQKVIKKGSAWLLTEVCKPHYPNADRFQEHYFNKWNDKYSHIKDVDFRMKIFKTDQWSFRWTVPSLRMYQVGAMPVLPFYDRRIVDLFTTIPTALLKDRSFQVAFLKRYYPSLAKVPWQEYGTNLYLYKTINNRNLAYRAYKKMQRSISGNRPLQRNWELFYLNAEGKKGLEDILLNNKAFCNVVPAERSEALLDRFYKDPSAANGYAVSMMHTFAQFMKTVF